MGGEENGAGREKKRDLREGVIDQMDEAAGHPVLIGDARAQDHVGELADGGVSEQGFEVIQPERVKGCQHDGDRSEHRGGNSQIQPVEQILSEDVQDDAVDEEDTCVNHGDCVEQ